MTLEEDGDAVKKLETLHRELESFLAYRVAQREKELSLKDREQLVKLFDLTQRKSGWAAPLVADLTELSTVTVGDKQVDMWVVALRVPFNSLTLSALLKCLQATRRAIGRLEYDIERGIRDKHGVPITRETGTPPKCFVSHGKPSKALDRVEEFLRTLGVKPLIVKEEPSLDKDVGEKVGYYLNQCDCVVILATGDDVIEGKRHPRQNVIHEVGLAQERHHGKVIYLLEEGAVFPSNIGVKVWEQFNQENMENVFLCIVRELAAFGILRVAKP